MKKYLFSMIALALFAVCFVASDDDSDNIAKEAYDRGYDSGFDDVVYGWDSEESAERGARTSYTMFYGAPQTAEEREQYQIYVKKYKEGYKAGRAASKSN